LLRMNRPATGAVGGGEGAYWSYNACFDFLYKFRGLTPSDIFRKHTV
jgi:hypothetical protein